MTNICEKCRVNEATYTVSDEKTGSVQHTGLIRITRIKKKQAVCKQEGCFKQRSFGFAGDKTIFCAVHKQSGMINLKHSRCKTQGCKLVPCYENNSGSKFCFIHCIRDMKCFNTKLAREQMGKYF